MVKKTRELVCLSGTIGYCSSPALATKLELGRTRLGQYNQYNGVRLSRASNLKVLSPPHSVKICIPFKQKIFSLVENEKINSPLVFHFGRTYTTVKDIDTRTFPSSVNRRYFISLLILIVLLIVQARVLVI